MTAEERARNFFHQLPLGTTFKQAMDADVLRTQDWTTARIEAGSTDLLFHSGARGATAVAGLLSTASRVVAVAGHMVPIPPAHIT